MELHTFEMVFPCIYWLHEIENTVIFSSRVTQTKKQQKANIWTFIRYYRSVITVCVIQTRVSFTGGTQHLSGRHNWLRTRQISKEWVLLWCRRRQLVLLCSGDFPRKIQRPVLWCVGDGQNHSRAPDRAQSETPSDHHHCSCDCSHEYESICFPGL